VATNQQIAPPVKEQLTPEQRMARMNRLKNLFADVNSHLHKSAIGLMNETINPLSNMNALRAQQIYDLARTGNFAQLQYLYNEIERCDPTFLVCVTRRCSALAELDWRVVRSDERLNRNADKGLIKEQMEFLETAVARIDNFPEAMDHLALSAFRGFSILNVWHKPDGMPYHFECLDSWNICRDRKDGCWLWNPSGSSFLNPVKGSKGLTAIPPEDMVAVVRNREIDWPGMKIFLRNAVGERDWGRFLETYGLPPVIITMPEFSSKDQEDVYKAAAQSVFEGRSGIVPYGSEVNYASESRGTNPFTEFIEHQMKLFVLMATGGTLTSLAESGSGTLAGEAQMDVWRQIVRSDVRIVSNAINKQLCERLIKGQKDFKGKPTLVEFRLDTEPHLTAKEVLDLAQAASSAGFEMDADEIAQATGFTIRKKVEAGFNAAPVTVNEPPPDDTPPDGTPIVLADSDPFYGEADKPTSELPPDTGAMPPPDGTEIGEIAANAEGDDADAAGSADTQLQSVQDGAEGADGDKETPGERSAQKGDVDDVSPKAERIGEELVRSLQTDFKEVADGIGRILALPPEEQAGAAAVMLEKIDKMVPDDPAMRKVIERQMMEAFDQQVKKEPTGSAPEPNKAIPN
jgi:phage gp29-like protein